MCGLFATAQALSLKESEKTALSEKLMGTRHSLAAISLEMERQKREAQNRQEQHRVGQGVPRHVGAVALPGGDARYLGVQGSAESWAGYTRPPLRGMVGPRTP